MSGRSVDCAFEEILSSVEQFGVEYARLRAAVSDRNALIVELRIQASDALRVRDEALDQVRRAIVAIRTVRENASRAELALAEERVERARLVDERSIITQQVALLAVKTPARS